MLKTKLFNAELALLLSILCVASGLITHRISASRLFQNSNLLYLFHAELRHLHDMRDQQNLSKSVSIFP